MRSEENVVARCLRPGAGARSPSDARVVMPASPATDASRARFPRGRGFATRFARRISPACALQHSDIQESLAARSARLRPKGSVSIRNTMASCNQKVPRGLFVKLRIRRKIIIETVEALGRAAGRAAPWARRQDDGGTLSRFDAGRRRAVCARLGRYGPHGRQRGRTVAFAALYPPRAAGAGDLEVPTRER